MEEKAQAHKARELEIAQLRAQQEKVQDQAAQRDELRARRSEPLPTRPSFVKTLTFLCLSTGFPVQ